jgi:hypothetical protein
MLDPHAPESDVDYANRPPGNAACNRQRKKEPLGTSPVLIEHGEGYYARLRRMLRFARCLR